MISRETRINAFVKLGKKISEVLKTDEVEQLAARARQHNGWFTPQHVRIAFEGAETMLEEKKLRTWMSNYQDAERSKLIGVVMAGNIPMAGLHDMVCVLISGHRMQAKLSSQDPILLKEVAQWLIEIEPAFEFTIEFAERLKGMESVIATGSNNTSRYFEYYFGKVPNIIRKNRVSCAVLTGNETDEELDALADDVFIHYGLGCRNVSKLFIPENFEPTRILERWTDRMEAAKDHNKYMNNYDYNRAIYLVNQVEHFDGGGMMMKEDDSLISPVSVLFYERYTSPEEVQLCLDPLKEKIQCLVSKAEFVDNPIPFGKAQYPEIDDYADGVDTMAFLSKLN